MMRRGKDDEKVMGPMFPRLHVNDTEKGGPRAPPRNKMALYEQLSIPSQRFNPGIMPLHLSNSSNFGSQGSSNQGNSLERNILFHQASPTTPSEKRHARLLEGASKNSPVAQLEQRKKPREEDDFRVPVFNTGMGQGQRCYEIQSSNEVGKVSSLSRIYSGRLIKVQNVTSKDLHRSSSSVIDLRKEVREQGDDRSKICSSGESQVKSASNTSTKRKLGEPAKESVPSPAEDYGEQSASRFSRMNSSDDCSRSMTQTKDNGCHERVESVTDSDKRDLSQSRNESRLIGDRSSPDEPNSESECHVEIRGSLQITNGDKSDDASETSMVDSLSGSDISPDDVVSVIGQKQFWKARRAIVNQQRMFAVQVFELHRLIKVQRLVAESPHLLLEESAYLGKPSFKGSDVKKLTSEYPIKPLVQINCKDDSGKPSHKLEYSAENAVGWTSVSSVKNGCQPANYGSYLGSLPPAPVPMDSKTNAWFYHHQSPGHQWLVPVMTPSEGLVYKPYLGPGFTGTGYGGCGPISGNFMMPTYGVASPSPNHQGMGFLSGAPQMGQVYFPPYGMQAMNPGMSGLVVEKTNQFAQPGSQGRATRLSGANFNAQQQSSCNLPAKKNGGNSRAVNSKATEVQGSSASSPDERVEGDRGISNATKGRNALPLFPMAQDAQQEASEPHDTEQPTRVIRVVPHNPRMATESAARIFRSIQEERKQHDGA